MNSEDKNTKIIIRKGEKKDCVEIRKLIQELADFEKMPDGPRITASILERDGFETDPPLFGCFVAEEVDKLDKESYKIVGFALYFYAYSTWCGKKLHLEDLYVTEQYRRKNIGTMLFKEVAKKVVTEGFAYLDLNMLSWNPAKAFYRALGCVNITDTEQWNSLRLGGKALQDLIQSSEKVDKHVNDA